MLEQKEAQLPRSPAIEAQFPTLCAVHVNAALPTSLIPSTARHVTWLSLLFILSSSYSLYFCGPFVSFPKCPGPVFISPLSFYMEVTKIQV